MSRNIIGKSFVDFIHPDDLEMVFESRARTINGVFEPLEYRLVDRDGKAVYVRTSSRPVYEGGEVVGITGIITDITEQKKARDQLSASLNEKDILLKEVHHRVKNNMQIISSLLNLQLDGINDYRQKTALLDCQSRIYSMALIHERIYKSRVSSGDYGAKSRSSTICCCVPMRAIIRYRLEMSLIRSISPREAVSCGLIVNELSPKVRHAFTEKKGGIYHFILRDGNDILLQVEDERRGLPDGFDPEKRNARIRWCRCCRAGCGGR
jgi:two-component sensor histidine kinase